MNDVQQAGIFKWTKYIDSCNCIYPNTSPLSFLIFYPTSMNTSMMRLIENAKKVRNISIPA